jgi:hypothetical protein
MTIEAAQQGRIAWIERKRMNAAGLVRDGFPDLAAHEEASAERFAAMSNEDFIKFVEAQSAFVPKMRSGLLPV